jgi:hypothetical protein
MSGGERERRACQILSGHPLQHDRGTQAGTHAIRQSYQPFCRGQRKLGVGTGKVLRGHPVACSHRRDARAYLGDCAGCLGTRDERQRDLIKAAPLIHLDEVQPHGVNLDQHLSGAGRWSLDTLVAQNSGTSGLVNSNGVHEGLGRDHLSCDGVL